MDLLLFDVFLTCCDHWREVHVDDLPVKCPRCRCKLKWGYDKSPSGPFPHILAYKPPEP